MSNKPSTKPTPMTIEAAARIHSSEAVKNGGQVKAGTFAPRAQHAAAVNQRPAKKSK